jgi:NAD(P)-dependent dehydrogenase (short-subunit alcohol dehydrogenase family)
MGTNIKSNARPRAFVTGAAQGIGAAIAVTLATEGYDLALSSRNPEQLADTVERVTAAGSRAVAVRLDQDSRSSIHDAVMQAVNELGGIDVLVNNAGVTLRQSALEVTADEWDQVVNVNLKGVFFMSQEVGRHFVAAGKSGCIINISSSHGLVAFSQRSTYGISKAGVLHMTRMLAYEWADHGIRVNAIAPGLVETPSRVAWLDSNDKQRETMLARVPLKRFTSLDDVSGAVCYLAGSHGSYITGQTIVLDGGITTY